MIKTSSSNFYGILEQHDVHGDDILRAVEEITTLGYAVIDSGYTPEQIENISRAFNTVYSQYVGKYSKSFLEKIDELNGVRLPLAFDKTFLDLAFNPVILPLTQLLIKGKFYLNQQNAIINPPGERYNQNLFHRDLPYQHFTSSRPLAINALFCVDDFTQLNGATVVVPCSHKLERFPSDSFVEKHAVAIEASAGSFIVLDCMTFHKGSFNNTKTPRRAVNHVYTIPYLKQQIDIPRTLGFSKDLDNDQREMLGYRYQIPDGIDGYLQSRNKS